MSLETPIPINPQASGVKPPSRSARPVRVGFPFEASLRIVLPVGMAALAIAAWQFSVDFFKIPVVILASPAVIFEKIVRFYPLLLQNSISTTLESLLAFFMTAALGVILAVAITYSRVLYDTLYPNLVFFYLIPKIALAPLFILWFGIGNESRIVFSVFISFFPMLIATAAGLANVDSNMIRLCRSLGATKWQVLASVRLPASIPYIFSGMKISVTLAIIGIVVGEFITSQSGLGYLILFASGNQDTALVFAAIAVLCVVGLLMYAAVTVAERVTNHWLVSTVTRK